jgi:hypothetical protein
VDEERDCGSGMAHQPHGWSQGGKHYQCHGRTETTSIQKEPIEIIDAAICEASDQEAKGIEVALSVLSALDQSGYKIVRKW